MVKTGNSTTKYFQLLKHISYVACLISYTMHIYHVHYSLLFTYDCYNLILFSTELFLRNKFHGNLPTLTQKHIENVKK